MRFFLGFIFVCLLSAIAYPQVMKTVIVNFTPATENVDGTPLEDLKFYQLCWSLEDLTEMTGTCQGLAKIPADVTLPYTMDIWVGARSGLLDFALYSIDTSGNWSGRAVATSERIPFDHVAPKLVVDFSVNKQ